VTTLAIALAAAELGVLSQGRRRQCRRRTRRCGRMGPRPLLAGAPTERILTSNADALSQQSIRRST
jgi:hypothetical protein